MSSCQNVNFCQEKDDPTKHFFLLLFNFLGEKSMYVMSKVDKFNVNFLYQKSV